MRSRAGLVEPFASAAFAEALPPSLAFATVFLSRATAFACRSAKLVASNVVSPCGAAALFLDASEGAEALSRGWITSSPSSAREGRPLRAERADRDAGGAGGLGCG